MESKNNNITNEIFLPKYLINELEFDELDQKLQNVDVKETYCSSANERYETNYIIFNLYK
jgi:hypothetical protein